jgi:hypothetical protein
MTKGLQTLALGKQAYPSTRTKLIVKALAVEGLGSKVFGLRQVINPKPLNPDAHYPFIIGLAAY